MEHTEVPNYIAAAAATRGGGDKIDYGIFFYLAQQLPVGQGLLIREVSISHTTTHHSR